MVSIADIKQKVADKLISWLLETKLSPIGWLNGYKTVIGNVLTVISGVMLALQQGLQSVGICPGWEYCQYVDATSALVAFLLSLLVKLVGEWHKQVKEVKVLKTERQ